MASDADNGSNPRGARPWLTLGVQGLKAFRSATTLQFGKLTVFYGENQSGKSTLLRSLPWLAEQLRETEGDPFGDSRAAPLGETFRDLGWRRTELNPRVSLTVPVQDRPDATFVTKFSDDDGVIVNSLRLGDEDPKGPVFDASYERRIRKIPAELEYVGVFEGADWSGRLSFRSVFPAGLPEGARRYLAHFAPLRERLGRLLWLEATRLTTDEPRSSVGASGPFFSSDGADLATRLEPDGGLLRAVSAWCLEQPQLGFEVGLDKDPKLPRPQFELAHPEKGTMPLRLAGEGVRSVLPVVVAAQWAAREDGPRLLAIEEPEAHLHPTTQIALTDLLVTAATHVPVVVETHSIYFLRALQRAVLRGAVSAEDVRLYWVERDTQGVATAQSVEMRPDGTLVGWLPERFEQEQQLAREIFELRWKRAGAT